MKYFGKVSYSGERYNGFQRQKKLLTVQGELEKQLSFLCGQPTLIKAAGRTDAGVHAKGQTFSFESKSIPDVAAFLKALNRLLPEDIYVLELKEVEDSFDARHSCCGKIYQYRFSVNQRYPLLTGKIAQLRRDDFHLEGFLQALNEFNGTHNFQNFTTKPEDNHDFIRTVKVLDPVVEDEGNLITITFVGTGFMRYQIRFMVGAAIRVATNRLTVEDIRARLNQSKREIMPFKAPAEGLCLMEVLYEKPASL